MRPINLKYLTLLTCLLGTSNSVEAIEYNVSVASEVESSSNVAQSENAVSGERYSLGLIFSASTENTRSWDISVAGNFSSEAYSFDELDEESREEFSARVFYRPPTSNFRLLLLESYAMAPRNRFTGEDVGNTRHTNQTTIQPSYFFNVTAGDRLNFELTKTALKNDDIETSESFIDGSRSEYEYSISWDRVLGEMTFFSFVHEKSEIDFDVDLSLGGVDYEQEDNFIRYRNAEGTTRYQVDLGISEITNDLNQISEEDLIGLYLYRQINRTHSAIFSARKGFDTLLGVDVEEDFNNIIGSSNEFLGASKVEELRLSYMVNDAADTLEFTVFSRDLVRVDDSESEQRQGLGITYTLAMERILNTNLHSSLVLGYTYSESEFSIIDVDTASNNIEVLRARYNYSQTRSLSYYLELRRRMATQKLVTLEEIDRNASSIILGFVYHMDQL